MAGVEARSVETFSVVAIGDAGAGKTNFIAMLYQHLRVDPDNERGYHLSTSLNRGIELNRQADKSASPGEDWPDPTSWVDDGIKLSFQIPLRDGPSAVLEILCIDYPGEYLRDDTAGSEEQREKLTRTIGEADAVLMLVDGYKVLKALQGDHEYQRELRASLRAVVAEVQRGPTIYSPKPAPPLQVLITKWDFLADDGRTLVQVSNMLIEMDDFRGMLVARDQTTAHPADSAPGRVRIIPVSVLGPGAIEIIRLQEFNGRRVEIPVKKQDFVPRPINLDVPLALILPDQLDQILEGLDPREQRRMRRQAERRLRRIYLRAHGQRLGEILEAIKDVWGGLIDMLYPGLGKLSEAMLDLVAVRLLQQDDRLATEYTEAERRAKALSRIDVQTIQRIRLLDRFEERVHQFEREFEGWDAKKALATRNSSDNGDAS